VLATFRNVLLALLLFPLHHSLVAAETRLYQLELILFSQNSDTFRDSEHWPADIRLPNAADAVQLLPADSTVPEPAAFTLLDASVMQLLPEAERIDSDQNLTLLAHLAWRQPGLPVGEAKAVWIAISEDAGIDEGQDLFAPPILEGSVSLSLSRYLHLAVDLVYRKALPISELPDKEKTLLDLFLISEQSYAIHDEAGRWQLFRKEESRRMRSDELHYMDHPMFGILVLITPHETDRESSP
jgi:hypothetical protein